MKKHLLESLKNGNLLHNLPQRLDQHHLTSTRLDFQNSSAKRSTILIFVSSPPINRFSIYSSFDIATDVAPVM